MVGDAYKIWERGLGTGWGLCVLSTNSNHSKLVQEKKAESKALPHADAVQNPDGSRWMLNAALFARRIQLGRWEAMHTSM